MNSTSQERRKYLRLDTVNIVKVAAESKPANKPAELALVFTKNISVEGICFLSEQSFDKDQRLGLEIQLPGDSKPLSVKGQVQWVRPAKERKNKKQAYEVGVKLFTIDESDSSRFISYVCSRMAARLGRYLHL